MSCTASGTAVAGQYENLGTVTGNPPVGPVVTAHNLSHYFGGNPGLQIVKKTNGEDADNPPGPEIAVGATVTWTYEVTNTGNQALTNVGVSDNQGVAVTCPETTLAPGGELNDSMVCQASGTVVAGQYSNTGTATGTPPTGGTLTTTDPSHHFGTSPGIKVEKSTNGDDADTGTGPLLAVGAPVTWTYVVTNTGNQTLDPVVLVDSDIGSVSCPQTSLAAGETMACTMTGSATAGQYENIVTATATPPTGPPLVTTDPSHYFGTTPGISLEKHTNGQDADSAPGPSIAVGSAVTWTYQVTNSGDTSLSNIGVSDNMLGAVTTCPATTLAAGASMTCTVTGTAIVGQYSNVGTVTGTPPTGTPVTTTDPSHYLGTSPGIAIEKTTNGVDADNPPGPSIAVGTSVTWHYIVTNTGNQSLTSVSVGDSVIGPIVCPDSTLKAGKKMSCSATGVAQVGQYTNLGTVTATPPTGPPLTHTDPSLYFGTQPGIGIEKSTNGQDADQAPGPEISEGATVTWEYVVTNSGDTDLTNVGVVDDKLGVITCPKTVLAAGESMTCTEIGTAGVGSYENLGTVTATPPSGPNVTATDASHYFGGQALLCDVDENGIIDTRDIRTIMRGRGRPAVQPYDPRDADGDGEITRTDAKICILECTNANCAP
jgi:hypothetical protein